MKIVYQTGLTEIPGTCMKCPLCWCMLPVKRDGVTLVKRYIERRHPKCPLVTIEEGEKNNG